MGLLSMCVKRSSLAQACVKCTVPSSSKLPYRDQESRDTAVGILARRDFPQVSEPKITVTPYSKYSSETPGNLILLCHRNGA